MDSMVYAWQLVSVNHIVQVNTWFAHGLHMVYARFTQGLRKVYPRFTHGLRMVYAWFTHGLRMVYANVDSIVSKDLSMICMFTLFLGILT